MKNDENHKTDEGCPTFQVFNQLAKEDECNIEDVNDGISCKNFPNKIDRCMKCSRILKIMKDHDINLWTVYTFLKTICFVKYMKYKKVLEIIGMENYF